MVNSAKTSQLVRRVSKYQEFGSFDRSISQTYASVFALRDPDIARRYPGIRSARASTAYVVKPTADDKRLHREGQTVGG